LAEEDENGVEFVLMRDEAEDSNGKWNEKEKSFRLWMYIQEDQGEGDRESYPQNDQPDYQPDQG